MVDHMIRNELIEYCDQQSHIPPMVAIKAFCDRYDFSEDDFREQSLRQMYWRHRKGTGSFGFDREVARNFSFVPMSAMAA